jgi:hypothetical protein
VRSSPRPRVDPATDIRTKKRLVRVVIEETMAKAVPRRSPRLNSSFTGRAAGTRNSSSDAIAPGTIGAVPIDEVLGVVTDLARAPPDLAAAAKVLGVSAPTVSTYPPPTNTSGQGRSRFRKLLDLEKKRPCLLVPNRLASGESDVSARLTARRETYMSSGRLLNFPASSSSSGSPRLCRYFGSPAVESGDALALHCGE